MLIVSKKFRGLFWTQFFGSFVDNFYKSFLLVWITYHLHEYSTLDPKIAVPLCSALFIVPFFLFSTIAGELAVKHPKAALIQKTKWFEIFLVSLAITAFWIKSVPLMMSILFLLGTQATFFGPMKYSVLPELIEPVILLKANGWIEMGTFLSILIGTLLGGKTLTFYHSFRWFTILLLVATFSGLIISYLIPTTPAENPRQPIHFNFIKRTYLQMIELRKDNRMLWMIQMISWFWLIGIVILTIIPLITKDLLDKDENTVTLLLTCMALCIGLGSITCHYVSKKIPPLSVAIISSFFVTLFLFVLSQTFHLRGFVIALGLFSFFCGLYVVPLYTYLQQEKSNFLKSHLIAMLNIFNSLWMAIGSVILTALLQTTSLSKVFLILACASLIQNFIFLSKRKIFETVSA